MTLLKNKTFIIYSFLFCIILIFKWEFLHLPYFSEEKPYVLFNIFKYSLSEILLHKYQLGDFADHPLLLPILLAPIVKVFGHSPFYIHFTMYMISILGLTFFIKTLQELRPTKKNLYWLAIFPIFLLPDYFIHMSNFRYEMLAATLAIMATYFHMRSSFISFFICVCLLSQARETTLAFLVSFIILDCIYILKKKNQQRWKFISSSIFAIILWSSFFFLHHHNHGVFSSSPASTQLIKSLQGYISIFTYDLKWFFFMDNRWVLSLISIWSLYQIVKYKKAIPTELLYFILPIIFYALGMSFHIFKAHYYLYPVIYSLYGLFMYFFFRFNLSNKLLTFFIIFCISNFFYLDFKKAQEIIPEDSRLYKDVINNYQNIIKELNENYSHLNINVEWPLVYYLQDPHYGYVEVSKKNVRPYFQSTWAQELGHTNEVRDLSLKQCESFRQKYDAIVILKHGNNLQRNLQEQAIQSCRYKFTKLIGNNEHYGKIYLRD